VFQELPHIVIIPKRKEKICLINDQHFQTVLEHNILIQASRKNDPFFFPRVQTIEMQLEICQTLASKWAIARLGVVTKMSGWLKKRGLQFRREEVLRAGSQRNESQKQWLLLSFNCDIAWQVHKRNLLGAIVTQFLQMVFHLLAEFSCGDENEPPGALIRLVWIGFL